MIKETYMRDALKKSFPEIKMVFGKQVDNSCSLRKPDVRIECLTHSIIIECDENRHQGYSCENKRTMELFQDLGNRPIVFIRFNPDKYTDADTKIEGCFENTKTGSLKLNKKEWNRRIKSLKLTINQHLKEIPEKEVSVDYLFF
jgi:hypothetical protein